jgi:hypothetical protein
MRYLSVTAFVTGMILCQGTQAASLQPSSPQEQAEFLAGITLGKESILASLQKSPEYRLHQKELQEQWTFCRKIRYGAMQQWAREHLARYPSTRGVLRYLFGGPDFLNAFAFFPDARCIVLGGLEPVGEVPPPEALDPSSLGTALKALEEALHTSLFCGYFITTEMKPQLAQGSFRGVLPVLYTELALTGNIIDSVSMVRPFGSPGVEIIYHRPGGTPQTLYYFQADLSNGKECRRFLAWLGDLGPGASYLKAASYLLPLDSFSETRNFLTRTSPLILQDDSGLPFRTFLPGEWQIQLYGVYTDPLPIFRLGKDPRLDEAYRSGMRIGSLPFGAGYHVQPDDANLLLAVRTQSDGFSPGGISQTDLPPPPVPAFASTTPKPRPIRIRKALPVPIKKAIAVRTQKTTPFPTPQSTPTPTPTPTPLPELTPTPTPDSTLNQVLENPPRKFPDAVSAEDASLPQKSTESSPPLQSTLPTPPSPEPVAAPAQAAPETQPPPSPSTSIQESSVTAPSTAVSPAEPPSVSATGDPAPSSSTQATQQIPQAPAQESTESAVPTPASESAN